MRQVELANVRSFYKSDEKSPFKNFPWKTGTMHFHYLSVRATAARIGSAPVVVSTSVSLPHLLCRASLLPDPHL